MFIGFFIRKMIRHIKENIYLSFKELLNKLKKRVFNILEDYDIENIVLNIVTSNKNNYLETRGLL